jgi:hypothetical protein
MPNAQGLIDTEINKGVDTQGATSAINAWTTGAVQNAMPSFYQALQGVRESAVRRGISTGDLGTSNEGDLASAFQRNIAGEVAQQSTNIYQGNRNEYLDLLSGQRDADIAEKNAQRRRKAGLWGGIGSVVGGAAGLATGGVAGAQTGASIGGSFGQMIGGY